jgi:hypothetical protein
MAMFSASLPQRLPDGRLRVPARAVADDGTIGDGSRVIGPDDPAYNEWAGYLDWLAEQAPPPAPEIEPDTP